MIKQELVEVRYCDVCGELASDSRPWFVMHGLDNSILFESKIVGDYCEKHMTMLERRINSNLYEICAERYSENLENWKSKELKMIEDFADEHPDFEKYWEKEHEF